MDVEGNEKWRKIETDFWRKLAIAFQMKYSEDFFSSWFY